MAASISATSALVLNWTDPKIWQPPAIAEYMRGMDLSDVSRGGGNYSPKKMRAALAEATFSREAGLGSVKPSNFQPMQKERTGDEFPFTRPDSSWIKGFFAT